MMIKRTLGVLLAAVLLCGMLPLIAAADSISIVASGYNTARGAGELVVYDDGYGDDTGTNMWGCEAIVGADNIVTEIGTGRSEIPAGGFVVSGHDDDASADGARMKAWVMENITIGDYVYFDKRTMTITVSESPLDFEPTVFYSVEHEVDGVNGTRGEDELIIYDAGRGSSTKTNAYGYEVAVDENGMVISLGGNDTAIPKGGFVVSGHSDMGDWLRLTVVEGMRASYDMKAGVIRFSYDAQSVKSAVQTALDNTVTAIADAKAAFVYADYKVAEDLLDRARTTYDTALTAHEAGGKDAEFVDAAESTLAALTTIRNRLCDSYTVQYRGVWVRPSQLSAAEVDSYVKTLHNAGINTVCVEGWFENGVIMELPEGSLFEKHPAFSYDVLQAYIDACHKYGMECHLWMPIMNIGDAGSGFSRSPLSKKPEWLSLSNLGTPDNPDGFMMVDPANEEARAYLVDFYEYLVTTYDALDGFELDYIRYYATGDIDFGYTEAAFAGFEEAYGYGVTPEYDPEADYWKDWQQYRRDCVTEMVRVVSQMMTEKVPHIVLSADVAPTPDGARNNNYQDWPRWLQEGLIDMLHPMAYGDGYGDAITQAVEWGGDSVIVATGLGVQTDSLGAAEMERQAREDNSYGAYGDFYFEAATYLGDHAGDALMQTVYRNEAIPPFLDRAASITACLDYMQGRIDDILLPLNGVTEAEATALSEAITTLKDTVDGARMASDRLALLQTAIDAVANEQAREVLKADLYRAQRITYVTQGRTTVWSSAEDSTVPLDSNDYTLWIVLSIAAAVVIAAVITAVVMARKKAK